MMRGIDSPNNPAVKRLTALAEKKHRDHQGLYLIEGPNLLWEAIRNGCKLDTVFFRSSVLLHPTKEEYKDLLLRYRDSITQTDPRVMALPDDLFDKAAQTETPQGVMAIVKKKVWSRVEMFGRKENLPKQGMGAGNVLVLDRLQDPGNLGTMLRTADGAGFLGAILMKGCVDVYSPKVVRACAGTLFRFPILLCDEPGEVMKFLAKEGKKLYVTAVKEGRMYYECDLKEQIALVIGNEGNGVCSEFLEGAAERITIPMAGNQESLNAAVAAGILMYETVRQRNGGY